VTGVVLVAQVQGRRWRAEVGAEDVVVAAGAVESARFLLTSTSDREPHGAGNDADQVGRHLQGHLYAGALGIFEDPVNDYTGPGPSLATNDFRHHNDDDAGRLVGGGMIANEFVPTPTSTYLYLSQAGLLPRHGPDVKARMRHLMPRMQRVVGPVQEVTSAESRVRLDPRVTDSFGCRSPGSADDCTPRTTGQPRSSAPGPRSGCGPRARPRWSSTGAGRTSWDRAAASTRPAAAGWARTRPDRSRTRTAGCGGTRTCGWSTARCT
jgi:choline dehydrogenase-like flavoprotein